MLRCSRSGPAYRCLFSQTGDAHLFVLANGLRRTACYNPFNDTCVHNRTEPQAPSTTAIAKMKFRAEACVQSLWPVPRTDRNEDQQIDHCGSDIRWRSPCEGTADKSSRTIIARASIISSLTQVTSFSQLDALLRFAVQNIPSRIGDAGYSIYLGPDFRAFALRARMWYFRNTFEMGRFVKQIRSRK